MAKKKENSNPKAGIIGFGFVCFGISALFGFTPVAIGVGAVLGLCCGKILSIMGSGLDTTTHNKQDIIRRQQEEARKIPLTGNETADDVITRGQEYIALIEKENLAIPDETLTGMINNLSEQSYNILRVVSNEPGKAPQVRKFMNYYLPTANRILSSYRIMMERGVSGNTLSDARNAATRGMDMILTACQKQIDHLHRDNLMDISTDIDVLEQMLKRDGYTDSGIPLDLEILDATREAALSSATAAEAQMRTSNTPVMDFSSISSQSDPSELSQKQSLQR